jgi:protein CpxP
MKKTLITLPVSALIAAGLMLGQSNPDTTTPQRQHRFENGSGEHRDGMFQSLNLSDAQKEQAKSIFSSARQSNQALEQQMHDARKALNDAAKSGASDAQIDQLAAKVGPLSAQLAAAQAKTFAKFYTILTPEQRTQLADKSFMGRGAGMGNSFSHRRENGANGWRKASPQTDNQQ